MGLFSRADPEEQRIEAEYVQILAQRVGSLKEAKAMVKQWIADAKAEAKKEGVAGLPRELGDYILSRASSGDGDAISLLARIRREGVRDDDLRWWWNRPDLERRMITKLDNLARATVFIEERQSGSDAARAAEVVRRFLPIYGDPTMQGALPGDDAPLPSELRSRVTAWLERQQASPERFRQRLLNSTSLNAVIRAEIRGRTL